jgi:putative MATE family efflux protein
MKGTPLELGQKPIGKLLLQYALPAIIAMTAASLYNIIDSIFIGHGVGALALSALAIAFPLMNLGAAFGSLVGVGAASLLSVRLGQKDYESANRILGNVLILNIIFGLALTVVGLPLLDPMLRFFGASDDTLPYARDFMRIILWGNVITHLCWGLNAMMRSSGAPQKAMYSILATVGLNTVLNPLFIFGFGWGIAGSALASVLSQFVVLLWQLRYFTRHTHFLRFTREGMHLRKSIVRGTIAIGMAPFLMNAVSCLIIIIINNSLKRSFGADGDMAIGAYGIINRVVFIFAMIVMGLNQGMQPIAGYNYGARQYDRLRNVLGKTIMYAMLVTFIGFLVGLLLPYHVAAVFTTDKTLIGLAGDGMRIVMLVFPIAGFQMVVANFFQSIEKASKSIVMTLSRQLIFLIPCLLILPGIMGGNGVWYSMPLSDLASATVCFFLLRHELRKLTQVAL